MTLVILNSINQILNFLTIIKIVLWDFEAKIIFEVPSLSFVFCTVFPLFLFLTSLPYALTLYCTSTFATLVNAKEYFLIALCSVFLPFPLVIQYITDFVARRGFLKRNEVSAVKLLFWVPEN